MVNKIDLALAIGCFLGGGLTFFLMREVDLVFSLIVSIIFLLLGIFILFDNKEGLKK